MQYCEQQRGESHIPFKNPRDYTGGGLSTNDCELVVDADMDRQ